MHGWDFQAGERGGTGGGGKGTWLKLANDGDQAVFVFLGEPFGREVVFDGVKYVAFTDAHKQQGLEPKLRMAVNVGVLETKEVKVFEMGFGTFKDAVALKHKFGFTDWAFELKRAGKPKDPKTTYSLLPERQLTAEEQAWMATAVRWDLAKLYDGGGTGAQGDGGLAQLVGRLGREAQQQFLARFGLRSLADLPAALVPKAIAFARELTLAPPLAAAPSPTATNPTAASPTAASPTAASATPLAATTAAAPMIDDASVAAIVADLRTLPQAQVTEWLTHVGVQRVRELHAARVPVAKEFLALLLKTYGPAATPVVDPFA